MGLNDRKVLNRILEYAEEEPLSSFRIQQSVKVLGAAIQLVRDDLVDAPLIVTLLRLHVDFYASVLQPGRLATNEQFGLARLGVVELVGSLIEQVFLLWSRRSSPPMFSVFLWIYCFNISGTIFFTVILLKFSLTCCTVIIAKLITCLKNVI